MRDFIKICKLIQCYVLFLGKSNKIDTTQGWVISYLISEFNFQLFKERKCF